jgi:hypothetical protein
MTVDRLPCYGFSLSPKGLPPLGKRRKEFADSKARRAERAGASESLGRSALRRLGEGGGEGEGIARYTKAQGVDFKSPPI